MNGNYALQAGFSVADDALTYETSDSEAAKTYVNVIAVKRGQRGFRKIQALVDVLKSDDIKNYINETYNGAVIPFEEAQTQLRLRMRQKPRRQQRKPLRQRKQLTRKQQKRNKHDISGISKMHHLPESQKMAGCARCGLRGQTH